MLELVPGPFLVRKDPSQGGGGSASGPGAARPARRGRSLPHLDVLEEWVGNLSRWAGFGLAIVVLLALSACAARAPRTALPAIAGDPLQHQRQREAALAAAPVWSLAGRVALSNGRDGGSGRLDWRQEGSRYEVALSAPVTRQSSRLSGGPGDALLEGLEGGPRRGEDATALLHEATRWEIPVEALASWVRGVRADEGRFGAAEVAFSGDGRLSRLEQGGWQIDYADWSPATGVPVELPRRLNAVRGDARVRLVVDRWE